MNVKILHVDLTWDQESHISLVLQNWIHLLFILFLHQQVPVSEITQEPVPKSVKSCCPKMHILLFLGLFQFQLIFLFDISYYRQRIVCIKHTHCTVA